MELFTTALVVNCAPADRLQLMRPGLGQDDYIEFQHTQGNCRGGSERRDRMAPTFGCYLSLFFFWTFIETEHSFSAEESFAHVSFYPHR